MKKVILLILGSILAISVVVGCTPKESKSDVDIKEVHEAIKEEFGEDYIPNMEQGEEEVESLLSLKVDDLENYIVEMPMISTHVDTFMAIKAKEGKGDLVETALNDYRDYILENSMQYPMNLAKVNAAKVVRHGDYSFFLMFGKYDDRDDATEEETLEFAEEEIERAEKVIDGFFK